MDDVVSKEYVVTVPRMPSPAEIVAEVKADLDLGDLSAVTDDINLPTEGTLGAQISWESSNDAISDDGTVNRPLSERRCYWTINATITYGTNDDDSVTDTKEFDFKVLQGNQIRISVKLTQQLLISAILLPCCRLCICQLLVKQALQLLHGILPA